MKTFYVERCCECPFVCCVCQDFGDYDCKFKPKGIDKKGVDKNGREFIIDNYIPTDTERPPDWCPLRKEGVITVQLALKWVDEEENG